MLNIKPKYKFLDKIWRIKYDIKKGELKNCDICCNTIDPRLACYKCHGLGVYRPEYKFYSVDTFFNDPYIITGLKYNDSDSDIEIDDKITYYLSILKSNDWGTGQELSEYYKDILEENLFLTEEEAQLECNKRNMLELERINYKI